MGYKTPDSIPTTVYCGRLRIPDDIYILAAVKGAILELTKPENWTQLGLVSPEDMAAQMQLMYDEMMEGSMCMIGALVHYASVNPPTGILKCDGATYQRSIYPRLYDAIDPSFHIDANSFTVPHIQDVFMLASGTSYTPLQSGGEEDVTLTLNQMPSHDHSYTTPTFNVDVESVGVPDPTGVGLPQIPATTGSNGGNQAHNNMPPYVSYSVGIVAK